MGISRSDIETLDAIGILQSTNSNILVVGHAQARLSKSGLVTKFEDRTEHEMDKPVFVPAENLQVFLNSMPDYRPLLASLLTDNHHFT